MLNPRTIPLAIPPSLRGGKAAGPMARPQFMSFQNRVQKIPLLIAALLAAVLAALMARAIATPEQTCYLGCSGSSAHELSTQK